MLNVLIVMVFSMGFVWTSPIIVDQKIVRYEEYVIEHEISAGQAKNAVLTYSANSVIPPPGCQNCTTAEMKYCKGLDLIADHCCCDKRYHEVLPYIPHTCYLGKELCSTIAPNCAEYTRLRVCCCDNYIVQKWKKKSKSSPASQPNKLLLLLVNIVLYRILAAP